MPVSKEKSATPTLESSLITTRATLNDLQPEWNELLQRSVSNNVFLTWEWTSSWWDCLSEDRQPWVIAVRRPDTGQLLGLAPLAQQEHTTRKGIRYRQLEFIGSYRAAPDHLDFIIDAEHHRAVTTTMLKKVTSQRSPYILRLDGLASDSTLAHLLQSKSGYRQISEEVCPYVNLPADWDSYKTTMGKSLRKGIRNRTNRLEKENPGTVSFSQVANKSELENALSTLIRLHLEVRESLGEISAFADKRMQEFHQQVASLFLKNGWLRFYQLKVGNEVIALDYNYHYNGVFSGYSTGYSRAWQKYSPGKLIMIHVIKQAIQEGASEYDFLRGTEPYKFEWTDQTRNDLNVEFSSSLVRKLHRFYLKSTERARIFSHRLKW